MRQLNFFLNRNFHVLSSTPKLLYRKGNENKLGGDVLLFNGQKTSQNKSKI